MTAIDELPLVINRVKLNKDIEKFPQIAPVTEEMHMTMKGVSRTVMLDRYSYKDTKKLTLGVGDLVVLTYKEHPKYPSRGYGFVKSIDLEGRKVTVQLDASFDDGKTVIANIDKVDKPLELFYEQIADRVSRGLASVEPPEKYEATKDLFYHLLVTKTFVPAGRVLMGAGSEQGVTFFNCYVMPMIHDSREGLGEHRKTVMEIMSRGGGVGTNGSTLRPRDTMVHGVNGRSSGSVTWLHDLSCLTNLVEQGGSRRGAQMIMLSDWHPDIIEFILSKVQNPIILRNLMATTTSSLIRSEAERKLQFTALTETETTMYEGILERYQAARESGRELSPQEINAETMAQQYVTDGGIYSVHNPDFLAGANISVLLTNDFMDAVENDEEYELRYPDISGYDEHMKKIYDDEWQDCGDVREWESKGYAVKVHNRIQAKAMWDLINMCATYSAEPGIFFIDNANEMTNATAYGQKVVATNPCGEQPLAPYSVCNLAAVNLAEHTKDGEIDYDKLIATVKLGVRMQDNVIDATPYFLEENTKQALGERRVGMGVMGLHDMLLKAKLRYGSPEANEVVDEVFRTMAIAAYEESIELAKEKGEFPFLNTLPNGEPNEDGRMKFVQSGFMKKMPEHIRTGILQHGIRNSHLLTVAPTGSTGTMMNVSTGLEPYFSYIYYRSGRLGQFIPVIADVALEWLKEEGYEVTDDNVYELIEKLPDYFVGAMDLTPEEHADTQCIIQRSVDSSISKTVNAPRGYRVDQVQKVYERLHKGGAKGGTVYVDGSRDSQVLTLTTEVNEFEGVKVEETAPAPVIHPTNRELGVEHGDICIVCEIGTVIESGGCNTCDNCKAQLKCGL